MAMNKMFCMDHTQNIDENSYTLPHLCHICRIYAKFLILKYSFIMFCISKSIYQQFIKQNFKILLHHLPTSNFI